MSKEASRQLVRELIDQIDELVKKGNDEKAFRELLEAGFTRLLREGEKR